MGMMEFVIVVVKTGCETERKLRKIKGKKEII